MFCCTLIWILANVQHCQDAKYEGRQSVFLQGTQKLPNWTRNRTSLKTKVDNACIMTYFVVPCTVNRILLAWFHVLLTDYNWPRFFFLQSHVMTMESFYEACFSLGGKPPYFCFSYLVVNNRIHSISKQYNKIIKGL